MSESVVSAATVGQRVDIEGVTLTVRESCSGKAGHWICLTHQDDRAMNTFRNQLQKDIHISDGKPHILGWWCPEHGLETP